MPLTFNEPIRLDPVAAFGPGTDATPLSKYVPVAGHFQPPPALIPTPSVSTNKVSKTFVVHAAEGIEDVATPTARQVDVNGLIASRSELNHEKMRVYQSLLVTVGPSVKTEVERSGG